jgi:hypothetical protein
MTRGVFLAFPLLWTLSLPAAVRAERNRLTA